MRMLLCANVQLDAVNTENLGVKRSHKWQTSRAEKLSGLIDIAAQKNAAYVALFGSVFGQKRVSESVIDSLFRTVQEDEHIQVLAFLSADEYNRINYRNDIPENLHLISSQTADRYLDGAVALRIDNMTIQLQLSDNDPLFIKKNLEGFYVITGLATEKVIPSFEPVGFDDAETTQFGYAVLDWTDEQVTGYTETAAQKYAYKSIELKILPEDGQKEILNKINKAITNMDFDTFLRITMKGRSAFGLTLNSDVLDTQLQYRVFFAEVYDNTIMDIDEEAFENDISLRSEFVRLALQDDFLSETERNRLISCGWNVLNGKEVSAE